MLNVLASSINDVEPAVTVLESPAHAGLLHGCITHLEDLRVLLAELLIEFFVHIDPFDL